MWDILRANARCCFYNNLNRQQISEITPSFSPLTGQLKLGLSPPIALIIFQVLTNSNSPQFTRGCGHQRQQICYTPQNLHRETQTSRHLMVQI